MVFMVVVCLLINIYYVMKNLYCEFIVNKVEILLLMILILIVMINLIKVIFFVVGIIIDGFY